MEIDHKNGMDKNTVPGNYSSDQDTASIPSACPSSPPPSHTICTLNDEVDFIIVNYWPYSNYGCILTAYAAQELVRSFGYTTRLLCFGEPKKRSSEFADKFLWITKVHSYEELIALARKVKGVIVGSDQVFRFALFSIPDLCLLSWVFGSRVKKIALSASFGKDKEAYIRDESYLKENFEYVKDQLKSFDYLSCRELSGKEIYKDLFGLESDVILDPVFLIDKKKYEDLAGHSTKNFKGKMVSFIIEDHPYYEEYAHLWVSLKKYLERKTKSTCEPISLGTDHSVEDWLKAIMDAEFVLTSSFHGTCFCLIFGKPFICVAPWNEKGFGDSRFDTLIKLFGIGNNVFKRMEDVYDRDFNFNIDYDTFEEKLSIIKKQHLAKIESVLTGKYSNNKEARANRRKIRALIKEKGKEIKENKQEETDIM